MDINDVIRVYKIQLFNDARSDTFKIIQGKREGLLTGYDTGLHKLNAALGGEFRFKKTFVIGARPGVGKSAFANILISGLIDNNRHLNPIILYWNFEMTNDEQVFRFISNKTGKTVDDLFHGNIRDDSLLDFINDCDYKSILFIDEPMDIKRIYKLNQIMRTLSPNRKIINVLDHMLLVKKLRGYNKLDNLGEISKGFKEIKKRFDANNIILSQLNRDFEKEIRARKNLDPMLSDLSGSDEIAHNADIVGILYKPSDYDIMELNGIDTSDKLFMKIVKNRGGRLGTLIFQHDLSINFIKDYVMK